MISNATKWVLGGAAALLGVAIALIARKASSGGLLSSALPMPECDDSITAVHHGGTRDLSRIRLIVLHSTEGDTAKGAAGWFAAEASGGSAHIVVDDDECYRTLGDDVVPWGAKGDRVNEDGVHIEMAGHAADDPKTGAKAYTREDWLSHGAMLDKAAAIVSDWARTYGVPLVYLTADDLREQGENARGITSHMEVTKAFDVGGGHMDPGSEFPIDVFLKKIGGTMPSGPGLMNVA